MCRRPEDRVGANAHACINERGRRIDDRDARPHVALTQTVAHNRFRVCKLDTVIDPAHLREKPSTVSLREAGALGVPFIGVNHLEGHLYANVLERGPIEDPYVAFLVSGGIDSLRGGMVSIGWKRSC